MIQIVFNDEDRIVDIKSARNGFIESSSGRDENM